MGSLIGLWGPWWGCGVPDRAVGLVTGSLEVRVRKGESWGTHNVEDVGIKDEEY